MKDYKDLKVVSDRAIIQAIMKTYLSTTGLTFKQVADKYSTEIRTDEDGDHYITLSVDNYVFQFVEVDNEIELSPIVARIVHDTDYEYMRLPSIEEYEAFEKNWGNKNGKRNSD